MPRTLLWQQRPRCHQDGSCLGGREAAQCSRAAACLKANPLRGAFRGGPTMNELPPPPRPLWVLRGQLTLRGRRGARHLLFSTWKPHRALHQAGLGTEALPGLRQAEAPPSPPRGWGHSCAQPRLQPPGREIPGHQACPGEAQGPPEGRKPRGLEGKARASAIQEAGPAVGKGVAWVGPQDCRLLGGGGSYSAASPDPGRKEGWVQAQCQERGAWAGGSRTWTPLGNGSHLGHTPGSTFSST